MEKEIYIAIVDRGVKLELIFLENEFVIDQLLAKKISVHKKNHLDLDSLHFIEVEKVIGKLAITNFNLDFVQEKIHNKSNKLLIDGLFERSRTQLILDCILNTYKIPFYQLKNDVNLDIELNEELFESGDNLAQVFLDFPSISTSENRYDNSDIYIYKLNFEYEVS